MKIPKDAPIRKYVPKQVEDVENLVIEYLNQMKNRYVKYNKSNKVVREKKQF